MWSRDNWLEPEFAKKTLETVSHAVEVSLTHFFTRSGIILLPSVTRCDSMPLVQVGRKMVTQERVISGVVFPIADSAGDCVSVMFSEAISNQIVGEARLWDDRLIKLRDNATTLVEPLCKSLHLASWLEPSFIFDMQGAAIQSMAAQASVERSTATVISVHLNGLDSGEWATILAILETSRTTDLRRAA
jgi:hypothetical protein